MPGLDDVSRIIGQLEDAVKHLTEEVNGLRADLKAAHTPSTCPLSADVRDLMRWKWKLTGMAAVIGAVVAWLMSHWPWGKH